MTDTPRPCANQGFFLVLEGIDGAGTTSQQQFLCEHLSSSGFATYKTAEPTDKPVGKLIRQVLRGELRPFSARALALLFAADRAEHLEREILPSVADGKIVVCDRYVLSSLAYQTTAGVPLAHVAEANAHFPIPDLTIYFDLPVEVAARRRAKRNQSSEIFEVDAFQQEVARRYLHHAQEWANRGNPTLFLDASRGFEDVSEQLVRLVMPAITNRATTKGQEESRDRENR